MKIPTDYLKSLHRSRSAYFRLITDVFLVSGGLFGAFMLRLAWDLNANAGSQNYVSLIEHFSRIYLHSLSVVLPINLITYAAFGFYTRGRFYTGRHKLICVFQAVTVAYLIVGMIAFMTKGVLIPRSVLPLGWSLTMGIVGLSRVWTLIWRLLVLPEESNRRRPAKGKIRSVLVIGGAGYIGSALLPKLLSEGYRVRILDMFLYGDEPIAEFRNHRNLEVKIGDLRRIEHVVEAMDGIDAVIHLGALVGDPACALDEKLTLEINLMATRLIAEVAKAHKVQHFIFASTCSVYGANDDILDERSALNPVSLYAKSKIASERVLTELQDECFTPVILRFGTIYGLSGRTRFDLVVNLLTAKAIVDGKITLFGGDLWRPFLHVDDAALALQSVLEAPTGVIGNEIFNVGSDGQNMTLLDVGEMIKSLIPSAELVDEGSGADRRNYRVNFEKIRTLVGFTPKWTMEAGIKQVIEAFEQGKISDYHDSKYSNVKFLAADLQGQLQHTSGWEERLIKESVLGPGAESLVKLPEGNTGD